MDENIIDLNLKLIKVATDVDKLSLNMFFDESNNIRVVRLNDNGTNENIHNIYFVLGGLSYSSKLNLDLNDIFAYIGAKQIPIDAKLKYFSRGNTDFKEILKETRLLKYFQFLKEKSIYIHFNVFHFLYYSLIDILDSLFEEDDVNKQVYFAYHFILKSDLIEVLDYKYEKVLKILREFDYPNIPNNKVIVFISELLDLYTKILDEYFDENSPDNFTKEMLRQMIKAKRKKNNLLFLENNEKLVITKSLFEIYLHNACLFHQENKIFDDEFTIKEKFEKVDSNYETKLNMKFKKSHDDRGIQLSDVLSGFIAKMLNFISSKTFEEIDDFIEDLDDNSINILKLFFEILDYSDDYCQYFFVWQIPNYVLRKFNYFNQKISSTN